MVLSGLKTVALPVNTNGNLGTESTCGQAPGLRLSTSPINDSETLVEVAGIEPAGAGEGTPANKRDSAQSPEALIKILTNLTDEDRRMLARIVERWGSLSEELKRAVLNVPSLC